MALDLSTIRGRTDAQDQRFTRTDSILPTRRVQQAPEVQVDANIRNGERGDPQVQELRQTLGLVDQAQTSLVNVQQAQQAQAERQNAQIAAGDSVNGTVNQDLWQKSEAYRQVIANGRADAAAATAEAEARTSALSLVAQGATANPTDPSNTQKVVGLSDVNDAIEKTFRSHLLDSQGAPVDFGDPSANVRMYAKLQQAREHILGVAAENIQAQEQGKAMASVGNTMQAELASGDGSSIERGIATMSKLGIPIQQAKNTALHAAIDTAITSKDVTALDKALASTREDGTPTWSTEERNTLLNARHTYAVQFEDDHRREVERTSMATLGDLAVQVASGKARVTPDMVTSLVNSGQLGHEYQEQALGIQFKLDQEAQQKSLWSGQRSIQNLELARGGLELKQAQARDLGERIVGEGIAQGKTGPQIQGDLMKSFGSSGGIDSRTFFAGYGLAKGADTDTSLVASWHAEDHIAQMKAALQDMNTQRQTNARLGHKVPSDDEFAQTRAKAFTTFLSLLRKGSDPDEAMQTSLMGTGGFRSPKEAQLYVTRARGAMTSLTPQQNMTEQMKTPSGTSPNKH